MDGRKSGMATQSPVTECILRNASLGGLIVWTQLTQAFVVNVTKANVLQMGGSILQTGD